MSAKSFLFYSLVIVSLLSVSYLRFGNLGHSNFIIDETTVMSPIRDKVNVFAKEFVLAQNKGPLQFWLAAAVSPFISDPYYELPFRIPFAIFNVMAVVMLYFYLVNVSGNKLASLLGAALFGVNGFIVAFGRIVQYQSLNLLFTISALFFLELYARKKVLKFALFGTLAYCFSFLAHWDALLFLPLVGFYLVKGTSIKRLVLIFGLALVVLLPFIMPFVANLVNRPDFVAYISSRVGFTNLQPFERVEYYRFYSELHNPFFFTATFMVFTVLSVLVIRKRLVYFLWYVGTLGVFLFFVKRSGTHLYNVLLPFAVVVALVLAQVLAKLPKVVSAVLTAFLVTGIGVLWYQSYVLFVDVSREYPWEREKLFGLERYETVKYSHENLKNNILGFPINRRWREVGELVRNYSIPEGTAFGYHTNEVTSIANYYVGLEPELSEHAFVIAVKHPYNFVNDTRFSYIEDKELLQRFKNAKGDTVSSVYVVEKLK